ncbi:hypothetical protein ABIA35_009881 [Catenulispora sp. MAP12-49]|uniref:hypothetical protein n=1 Tax=Catenulispora sp. MAP12-49 TaxID=3156302 RepID=UPI0035162183
MRSDLAASIPDSEIKDRVLGLLEVNLSAPESLESLEDVRGDVVASIPDSDVKATVLRLIDNHARATREATDRREREVAQAAEARDAAAAEAASSLQNSLMKLMVKQRVDAQRSDMFKSWFNRETIASAVGPIVMISLAGSLIVAMFTHTAIVPVVSDSFLLIRGYFFGNATSREAPKASEASNAGNNTGDGGSDSGLA